MIDLHCHVLPGIDDGALDLDDSLGMARQAEADGIREICATPHIRHDHDVRIGELAGRVAALNDVLAATGVATRIRRGGEVAETIVDRLDDDELRAVSLGGGERWVLLEPRPGPLTDRLVDVVRRLHGRGFRSVIAHPERHLGADIVERLAALVRAGSLVQVTAATLTDPVTEPGMFRLAAAGVLHLLASDAHSSSFGRPVALSGALERLWEVESLAPHIDWVAWDAPFGVVSGEDVEPPFPPTG